MSSILFSFRAKRTLLATKYLLALFLCISNFTTSAQTEKYYLNSKTQQLPTLSMQTISDTRYNELNLQNFKNINNLHGDKIVLKEKLEQDWNRSNNEWINANKYTYNYNTSGYTAEIIQLNWSGTEWKVIGKNLFKSYDLFGNLLENEHLAWKDSIWVNSVKYLLKYNSNGKNVECLWLWWNDNLWVNAQKETYSYDSNQNLTTALWETWKDNNLWVNERKYIKSYDSNNDTISTMLQFWEKDQWEDQWRGIYTYYSNPPAIEVLSEIWSSFNQWEKRHKRINFYDLNELIYESINYDWVDSMWVNNLKSDNLYDSKKNITEELVQCWWNDTLWINQKKITYAYQTIPVSIHSLFNNHDNSLKVKTLSYGLYIQKTGYNNNNLMITFYNLKGRKVAFIKANKYKEGFLIPWDNLKISAGIYLITLFDSKNRIIGNKKITLKK